MLLDNINLNHIRIFVSVYRHKSMTRAAADLHMTQSGVSQHVKFLEDILALQLFDRVKQKLIPTAAGTELFERCSTGLTNIETALREIKAGKSALSGTITLGSPIEFGNSIIMPLLADFAKKNPLISYQIFYGHASEMNGLLLNGTIDFAITDKYPLDKHITMEPVCDEILALCASKSYLKTKGALAETHKYFESLEYIEFMPNNPFLNMWFKHHTNFQHMRFQVRATLMDVQGVAKLIASGLGAGVLSQHAIDEMRKTGHEIEIFKGSGKPLTNEMSIAYVTERNQRPVVKAIMDSLKKALKS